MEEPQKIGKAGPRVRLLDAIILVAAVAAVLAVVRGFIQDQESTLRRRISRFNAARRWRLSCS
jgi:hypothetical protein